MKIPPRKLLKVAKKISANSPGTAAITLMVPARSILRCSCGAAGAARSSSSRTNSRCANAAAVNASAKTSVETMPPQATRKPLITEVVRKPTPETMPTSPLALSRRSSGIISVTRVGSAIPRMLPAMTPSMTSDTRIHTGAP